MINHREHMAPLVKLEITQNTTVAPAAANITNKKIMFKNCTPLISCISRINNMKVDYALILM